MSRHGVGLRKRHYQHLLDHGAPSAIDFFEVIAEDFFADGGRPWHVLERVRAERPISLHGVSMGIGDAGPLSEEYLGALERVIARVDPFCVSDHLCWVSSGGRYGHELWPLPYDGRTLAHVAAKIAYVQDRLRRRLVLENVSRYVAFDGDTLAEPQFLNALAARTGCGILLDVNNVYVSSVNLGFDADAYLAALDRATIAQLHLSGHTDCGSFLMDTHVGPIPECVSALYRRVVERFGTVPALIEWDTDVPELPVLEAESIRMRAIEQSALSRMELAHA